MTMYVPIKKRPVQEQSSTGPSCFIHGDVCLALDLRLRVMGAGVRGALTVPPILKHSISEAMKRS